MAKKEEKAVAENSSIMKILQSPVQVVFMIGSIFILACFVPFTQACIRHILKVKKNKPEGYEWPEVQDLYITLVAAVIFAILEAGCKQFFFLMYLPFCKEQKDLKMRQLRSEKGSFCIYKAIYFIWATAWGYYVLMDQDYLPRCLGGSGNISNHLRDQPYPKHAPGLKYYLLVTQGYHFGGLFMHFFKPRKNDFVEMALHHIVTIYLFSGCYLINLWEVGTVVAYLHDIADITTNIVKGFSESRFKNATAVIFVLHMAIWFYTRITILPWCIYKIHTETNQMFGEETFVIPFFCFLLGCMYLLHCYWFSMFVQLLNKFVSSGSTEDTQSQTRVASGDNGTNKDD